MVYLAVFYSRFEILRFHEVHQLLSWEHKEDDTLNKTSTVVAADARSRNRLFSRLQKLRYRNQPFYTKAAMLSFHNRDDRFACHTVLVKPMVAICQRKLMCIWSFLRALNVLFASISTNLR